MTIHQHEVLIIGAGMAGLRAAIEANKVADVAVLTKIFPTRSHSGAAQGGMAGALGNLDDDNWEFHMFDTVKGSDYLGDQDAIEIMCREAPELVYELEHMGTPFSRTPEGKIAQRRFGGHTLNFGEKPALRANYSADYTGHVVLHCLYDQCVKNSVRFYSEFLVTYLIIKDNVCRGVVAWDIRHGGLHVFHAKAVMFGTGGYGRAWRITTNAFANTGDGLGVALTAGLPLEDMEFVQFHPTGLYKSGILMTEGARGEGGYLKNKDEERFMKRYAPNLMELGPRDLVSRSIQTEIIEGRGAQTPEQKSKGIPGDFVWLDVTHLGEAKLREVLPQIFDLSKNFVGVDPAKAPVPIQPTAHYSMGGIPVNAAGRVVCDAKNTEVRGLYAAGECACMSIHGANRLGCNSTLDATFHGRQTGRTIARDIGNLTYEDLPPEAAQEAQAQIDWYYKATGKENLYDIRGDLQDTMQKNLGIFREAKGLEAQLQILGELKKRFSNISLKDKSQEFNTELQEAIELGNLLSFAETIVVGALARQECRGAHWRTDHPARDDAKWLKHTLAYREEGKIRLDYKPVVITRFQPKERKY
jgi:succinate dehydrogenase / fumarate reductase flavoprotein subunit